MKQLDTVTAAANLRRLEQARRSQAAAGQPQALTEPGQAPAAPPPQASQQPASPPVGQQPTQPGRQVASMQGGTPAAQQPQPTQPPRPRSPRRTPTPTTPTRQELELLDVGAEIATGRPWGDQNVAFLHPVLCQVSLPRKAFEGEKFIRQSGAAWVSVQAGVLDEGKGPVLQPIPYGAMPRLALAWISTYATRHGSREIPIGHSAAEFLRSMGVDDDGRRYATLRKQMHALAACRLQLGCNGRTFSGQPITQFDAWSANGGTRQRSLWPGVMVLSEDYYKSLLASAVPLDNRALLALGGSSLALDIYAWLAHRLHRIEGRPVDLHWGVLYQQFGQEYRGKNPVRDFRAEFRETLQQVLAVYPQAKVQPIDGGLRLSASPAPVAKMPRSVFK